jgi:C4-dicarboxylate-specific signal transduction histidine kinase
VSNSLYQSLLSRLATIAPLFAKTLLDQAIAKRGKDSHNIAAIDLLDIIKTEINPKLSRDEFRTNALMQAGSGFIIYDTNNSIIFLSPMIKKMARDLKLDGDDLFNELKKISFCRPIHEVSELLAFEIEVTQLMQTFDISIAPIFDNEMKITSAVALVRDITLKAAIEDEVIIQSRQLREEIQAREKAQKELELNQEQLFHNSKLASLGEMAGGIAHEINNPLAIVMAGVELMELQSKRTSLTPEALKIGVDRIKMASTRIKNIIEAMRTLTRVEHKDEMVYYPVEKLLSEVLSLCYEKSISSGIKITVENEIHQTAIQCLPTELGQVLINLLNNSFDAIADHEEKFIRIKLVKKNGSIVISIIDSGKGIPLDVERKMFDPFFTTKPVGKGVGIGMSISKKIIKIHQGTIKVDRKSANTKIDITLPAVS